MEILSCYNCSYPIGASYVGQSVKCPWCGATGKVSDQAEVPMRGKASSQVKTRISSPGPGPLDFILGLLLGMVFGPAMKDAVEKGVRRLP
jgi:hypothetical protein